MNSPYNCTLPRPPSFQLTGPAPDRSRDLSLDSRTGSSLTRHRSSSRELAVARSPRPKSPRVSALVSRMTEASPVRYTRTSGSPLRSPREETRRPSWRKEFDFIDDDLEKIKNRARVNIDRAENKVKLESFDDSNKKFKNTDITIEFKRATSPTSTITKPSFESKYKALENKIDEKRFKQEQEKINEIAPKKGSWRKEFAKFEDDLEFEKIRKENLKKIEMYAQDNICEGSVENVLISANKISRSVPDDLAQDVKVSTQVCNERVTRPLNKLPR